MRCGGAVEPAGGERGGARGSTATRTPAAMAWEPSEFKKDVTAEMPNAYDPKVVEGCWGEFWEKEGLMGADAEVRPSLLLPSLDSCVCSCAS